MISLNPQTTSMSLYDFFFPQQATAQHLRSIVQHNQFSNAVNRVNQARAIRKGQVSKERVEELEDEIAQLTIVMEALLEVLGDSNAITMEMVARKISEIDARDGVIDCRITKKEEKKDEDDGPDRPELLFPDA